MNDEDRSDAPEAVGVSERFTTPELAGISLHTLHRGDRDSPAAIFLHGGGANVHWWDHLAPPLARRCHAVALDFRGHGDSDYPTERLPGAFDRDLAALIDHLRPDRPILVAHSMGAGVALNHAASCGELRGVVAIEFVRGAPKRERRSARLALASRRTYPTRDHALRRYQFIPRTVGVDEALRLHIAENSLQRESDGRFGFKFDPRWFAVPPQLRASLSEIRCPVLLIRGGDSTLLASDTAREIAAEIPQGRLLEVPGAGHNVHLERPPVVLAAIDGFFDEIL